MIITNPFSELVEVIPPLALQIYVLVMVILVVGGTVLFGGVLWSKFAHMFFKPAAAFQKRLMEADGSRENLPAPADC